MMKTGATLARGQSKQDYETPTNFMLAVEKRFGKIEFDLAAHSRNNKCENYFSLERGEDSLALPWPQDKLCWLNPPFSNITPWAKKCYAESVCGCRILFLVPGSVGANWFGNYVLNRCLILALGNRIKFVGAKDPYPKDCILACYGYGLGFEFWKWKP